MDNKKQDGQAETKTEQPPKDNDKHKELLSIMSKARQTEYLNWLGQYKSIRCFLKTNAVSSRFTNPDTRDPLRAVDPQGLWDAAGSWSVSVVPGEDEAATSKKLEHLRSVLLTRRTTFLARMAEALSKREPLIEFNLMIEDEPNRTRICGAMNVIWLLKDPPNEEQRLILEEHRSRAKVLVADAMANNAFRNYAFTDMLSNVRVGDGEWIHVPPPPLSSLVSLKSVKVE